MHRGHHWSILWIFSLSNILFSTAIPDPDAFHELSKDEYETFLRDLHPPSHVSYDTDMARYKRQAGIETYEYNSDEEESGPWEEWGQPSTCSR